MWKQLKLKKKLNEKTKKKIFIQWSLIQISYRAHVIKLKFVRFYGFT